MSDSEDFRVKKILTDSRGNLEKTEALRLGRQLLRPEDYVRHNLLNIPLEYFVHNKNGGLSGSERCECCFSILYGDESETEFIVGTLFVIYMLFLIIVTFIVLYLENIWKCL